jgi:hypothetical protein
VLNKEWFSNVPKEWDLTFLPIDSKEAKNYMTEPSVNKHTGYYRPGCL